MEAIDDGAGGLPPHWNGAAWQLNSGDITTIFTAGAVLLDANSAFAGQAKKVAPCGKSSGETARQARCCG
ncbi:hypothetical protein [Janthinobacterium sp. 64]|uniref:hypothetical protein n=1 Tax=Janthinobacterium sp. 64 TaxID=2035208 RepID=UPI0012FE02E4|nr:hypothetical protein [Janthinobacterium sp. 64]